MINQTAAALRLAESTGAEPLTSGTSEQVTSHPCLLLGATPERFDSARSILLLWPGVTTLAFFMGDN